MESLCVDTVHTRVWGMTCSGWEETHAACCMLRFKFDFNKIKIQTQTEHCYEDVLYGAGFVFI